MTRHHDHARPDRQALIRSCKQVVDLDAARRRRMGRLCQRLMRPVRVKSHE